MHPGLNDFPAEQNPQAARNGVLCIQAAARQLEAFPEIGKPLGDGRRELFTAFGAGAYVLRYQLEESGQPVVSGSGIRGSGWKADLPGLPDQNEEVGRAGNLCQFPLAQSSESEPAPVNSFQPFRQSHRNGPPSPMHHVVSEHPQPSSTCRQNGARNLESTTIDPVSSHPKLMDSALL